MTWLLRLKHWQLFLALLIPVVSVIPVITLSTTSNPQPFWLMPVTFLACGLLFLWLYALGVNLYPKLPPEVPMNVRRFKFAIMFPAAYMFIFAGVFTWFTGAVEQGQIQGISPLLIVANFLLLFVAHLLSMACMIYVLYFTAKSLKAVEWQKPVTFADYAGEFFLIWFFPLGVWFIQPRLNEMFAEPA